MYVCMYVESGAYSSHCNAQGSQNRTGVTGNFKEPSMGAGTQTQAFWKGKKQSQLLRCLSAPVLVWGSIAVMKHRDQMQVGEEEGFAS